ncbi:uncharacterized protein [Macrobrachium rosenbergii]|uniref:uncharacterized protein isoform X2 n=1 Tax=Macrobrachium rosenbergii TaxID=79674 RepID=UPI0034D3CFF3
MADWSNEKNINFIEDYRSLTCLWKANTDNYKDRVKRSDALMFLKAKYDLGTSKAVLNKIKCFRSYFRRVHKYYMTKRKSSSGAEDVSQPSWILYKHLLFILDGEEKRPGKETFSLETDSSVTGGESHAEDNLDLAFDMEGDGTQHSVDSQKSTNIRENSSPVDPIAIKRPRKQITDVDEECETFGRHVAVQLKQLPTTQRILAQDELQKVLTRYRLAAINGGPAASPQPSASDNYYSDPLTIVKEEVDET